MPLVDSLDCRRVEDAERGVRSEVWREAMAEAEKGSARREPVQDSSEFEVVRLAIDIEGVCQHLYQSHSSTETRMLLTRRE